jgi:hypothetical protein
MKNKNEAWFHLKTIETWEEMYFKDLQNKNETEIVQRYKPICDCFLCEYYLSKQKKCHNCPFAKKFSGKYTNCYKEKSPFKLWAYKIHRTKKDTKLVLDWLYENLNCEGANETDK